MGDQEFKDLVEQLKRGNNSSLRFIFEEHAEYCINNLQRKTGCSQEEAEDILMDAIINFREKAIAGKISYMTSIRNYIYTVCINMQRVKYQSRKRIEGKRDEVMMFFQSEDKHGFDPDEADEETGRLINLSMQAFRALGENCQKILHMFYVDEMNMTDIAEKLGLANANVAKTTKSRCYKKWMENVKTLQKMPINEDSKAKK